MAAPKIEKLLTPYNFTNKDNVGRIKYIVIHYVGALGGAKANCQYYASKYIGASAHYFVGFDGEIWQSVGDEDIAWHCGANSYRHAECRKSAEEREYIPIEEIQSTVNKVLRIESLQPVIKNKYLKFNREHKTLLKQLQEFPMGKNDDAPDGLQMAVQLAQSIKAVASKANYKTVLRRRFRMGRGAY